MTQIIDRRLNAKKKSTVNRQRFLRRYKNHIKKAVREAVNDRSITDMISGEKVTIPQKDISEPNFQHAQGGHQERILPGNDQFVQGDQIPRPKGDQGQGGNGEGASDSGEGEDDFSFNITQDEFLNYVFEDLTLPNLVKRQLAGVDEFEYRRAGFSNDGSPGKVNIVRSLKSANSRRIALTAKKKRKLKALLEKIALLEQQENENSSEIQALKHEAHELKKKIKRIPWLDDFDLKYNLHVKTPIPSSRAVMFCLMDVSGSMTQETKDIAKRFFLLLYLFLQRNYDKIDVVFIRHHTSAKEVDEHEFFYSRETGGTIVSSALNLMQEIIEARYPANEWNIYGAQASDGDNWNDDSLTCHNIMTSSLLPLCQYFSYVEITQRPPQSLWREYQKLQASHSDVFAIERLQNASDIYPVFRQLFHKKPV